MYTVITTMIKEIFFLDLISAPPRLHSFFLLLACGQVKTPLLARRQSGPLRTCLEKWYLHPGVEKLCVA
jgi:hypothetical protein